MEEKTYPQQKSLAEKQSEILIRALENAKKDGVLLNAKPKASPTIFDNKFMFVSPSNAILLTMHSEQHNADTNTYASYSKLHQRSEAVRQHEKGVPFTWVNRNEFVNKKNPDEVISRKDYNNLSDEQKKDYKVNPREEVYTLFNISQSTMKYVHPEDYQKEVDTKGHQEQETSYMSADDKQKRMVVNDYLQKMKDFLVPIHKSTDGTAYYDEKKDAVALPTQKSFDSYESYVQEALRQFARATGSATRLNRDGVNANASQESKNKELLTSELVTAVKMMEFGMPAKLSNTTVDRIPDIIESLKKDPQIATNVLNDVNRTIGMMKIAEKGEKIVLHEPRPAVADSAITADIPDKFKAVTMLQDDNKAWAIYVKPEDRAGIATHPSYEDRSKFFDAVKSGDENLLDEVKKELGKKYYSVALQDPSKTFDLFKGNASQEELALISKVNSFKSKDMNVYLIASIADKRQNPIQLTQSQWSRMFFAPDKRDFKVQLASVLYKDAISKALKAQSEVKDQAEHAEYHEVKDQHQNQEEKAHTDYHQEEDKKVAEEKKKEEEKKNSPEQKEKEKQEEKAKEEATKAETKAVAAIALSPMLKQFYDLKAKHPDALLLFRCGDFYETYDKDARKAAEILAITLTRKTNAKNAEGKPLEMAGFPHHALDVYLPKLIRAGQRVAICDQIEQPKETTQRSINDLVSPNKSPENNEKQVQESEQRKSGLHR